MDKVIEQLIKKFIDAPCCKVCACENGKKIHCACHRKQLKDLLKEQREDILKKLKERFSEEYPINFTLEDITNLIKSDI